jgi:predicted N-acetyltransferase YhbS
MAIVYKLNSSLAPQEAAEIFDSSGIKRPTQDLNRIARMLEHADVLITAWDEDQPVGIARAITDYAYCCYLSDLAVRKEYQKQGIGKRLVTELQAHLGEEVSLLLLSAPGAMEYYPQIGFQNAENAFLIRRTR